MIRKLTSKSFTCLNIILFVWVIDFTIDGQWIDKYASKPRPASVLSEIATSGYISPMATQLPYSYYPSTNEIEVAFDIKSTLIDTYFGSKLSSKTPGTTSPGLAYALYDYGQMIPKYDFYRKPRDPKKIDFLALTPMKTGVADNLKFNLDDRTTGWCAIYTGYIEIPSDGIYTINVRPFSDLRLYLDGRLQISTVDEMTYIWKGCAVALKAGKHEFALSSIAFTIERIHPEFPPDLLHISGSGLQRQPIPDVWFSHTATQLEKPTLPAETKEATSTPPAILKGIKSINVEVLPVGSDKVLVSLALKLNNEGRGQERFSIPDLPDGEYVVDYIVSGTRVRQPITFCRVHLPFEGNNLGIEHKIYPPFERLNVKGRDVSMVDRTYTMNSFGAFDSIVSKGREILAAPMKLVCETASGRETWQVAKHPSGYTPYPDEAVFTGGAICDAVTVNTKTLIQEDGCARVEMQLSPGREKKTIQRLWLEIVMNDKEAPMFHFVNSGCYTLRTNYGGKVPRGGKITWDLTGKRMTEGYVPQVPSMWKAEPGPNDGVVFDATNDADTASNFLPYIWMGAAERGIAWFTGEDRCYINNGKDPMMELSRAGDKVVLRIYFIRKAYTITKPYSMTYGLVASPTKPMRTDWRTHKGPGGGGLAVIAWGAYRCADKYPDNHDFSIVDKLQEARINRQPKDTAFFRFRDRNRYYLDWGVYESPWLKAVTTWYGGDARTYFEEHYIQSRDIEWKIFQDEWAHTEFARFQPRDPNGQWLGFNYYGCTARSYRDFVLYYANEWMKRGVSLYFDNTFPKWDDNPYSNGFYDGRSISIWNLRDYYRRIYKLMSYYNEKGSNLNFTLHMTNSPVIPTHTWCTDWLDLEQRYRKTADGKDQPFPWDYTQSMTLGRTVGVKLSILNSLRNLGSYGGNTMNDHQQLSSWGMSIVHEINSGGGRSNSSANRYNAAYRQFGYPADVTIHNYWEDDPFITVNDDRICWIALTKTEKPFCLVVLQSYAPEATTTKLLVPKWRVIMDAETGEIFNADAGGQVSISLSADYGTRMLIVGNSREDLPDKPLINPLAP